MVTDADAEWLLPYLISDNDSRLVLSAICNPAGAEDGGSGGGDAVIELLESGEDTGGEVGGTGDELKVGMEGLFFSDPEADVSELVKLRITPSRPGAPPLLKEPGFVGLDGNVGWGEGAIGKSIVGIGGFQKFQSLNSGAWRIPGKISFTKSFNARYLSETLKGWGWLDSSRYC